MKIGKILSLLCVLALFAAAPAAARHGGKETKPHPSSSSQAYKAVTEGQKVQARQITNSRNIQRLGDDILPTSDEQAYQSRNKQIRQQEKNRKKNSVW